MTVSRVDDLLTLTVWSFVILVASGRATDWPGGFAPLKIADLHGVLNRRHSLNSNLLDLSCQMFIATRTFTRPLLLTSTVAPPKQASPIGNDVVGRMLGLVACKSDQKPLAVRSDVVIDSLFIVKCK